MRWAAAAPLIWRFREGFRKPAARGNIRFEVTLAMSHNGFSRRYFFFGSLAATVPLAGFGRSGSLRALGYKSPNEKLNIASIGAGGKAASDIRGCSSENIVALCDPDD